MNEISLHIEFLLHQHDCVIVPGLGGFVINTLDIERNGLWGVDAPRCELIFNSQLTYNDGLLAESLMKTNKINFEAAIKKIDAACNELKQKLIKGEHVVWENLGAFKGLNEVNERGRPIFSPNKSFIRPQYYGLTNARLKPTALFSTKDTDNKNAIPLKPFIQYISSGIAMAILLFFVVVSYNNFEPRSQHAEMVSNSLIFNKNESKRTVKSEARSIDREKINTNTVKPNSLDLSSSSNADFALNQTESQSNYYIVVGVYEVRDVAEKTLHTLKEQGFMNASMLNRSGRLDVYSASFANKNEAQIFLRKFHDENPNYHDAWLLRHK